MSKRSQFKNALPLLSVAVYCTGSILNMRSPQCNLYSFIIYFAYSTAVVEVGFGAYILNCRKITASSTIVPKDPMSHGVLMMRYSFSNEWKRMPAPYVRFPINERRKKRSARPVVISLRYCGRAKENPYRHKTSPCSSSRFEEFERLMDNLISPHPSNFSSHEITHPR